MTIRSMTGFGRAAAIAGGRRITVEIRSVNQRGFDAKIRSRDIDLFCEAEVGRMLRAAVERGALTVSVREEAEAVEDLLDAQRLKRVHAALERVRGELGLPGPVDLATTSRFLAGDERGERPAPRGEELWSRLRPVVGEALSALIGARDREGSLLGADLRERVGRLLASVERVEQMAAGLPARAALRLAERVAELARNVLDPARLAQEVALAAERLDVSEEITRLRIHLAHLQRLLDEGGAVGRKLDFVIQEVGRELNTVVSKAQDAQIATLIVEAKSELEKIREQAQNIE